MQRRTSGGKGYHLLPLTSALPSGFATDNLEPAAGGLLPLLYRRWPAAESALIRAGQKVYLTLWLQNHERMRRLAELVAEFKKIGIRCLALKGAALALRCYRNLGVRGMRDFDLLVAEADLESAAVRLEETGYRAEGGSTAQPILHVFAPVTPVDFPVTTKAAICIGGPWFAAIHRR